MDCTAGRISEGDEYRCVRCPARWGINEDRPPCIGAYRMALLNNPSRRRQFFSDRPTKRHLHHGYGAPGGR